MLSWSRNWEDRQPTSQEDSRQTSFSNYQWLCKQGTMWSRFRTCSQLRTSYLLFLASMFSAQGSALTGPQKIQCI